MDLLVLGPQGAGKGTQAKRIAAEYEVPHVSTGDMFRAAIAAQTELGKRVQPILASGALVPDDVTVALKQVRQILPHSHFIINNKKVGHGYRSSPGCLR